MRNAKDNTVPTAEVDIEDTLENGASEVQVAVVGDVTGSTVDGKPAEQKFTPESLKAVAENQKGEILVDREHASEKGESTEAMGWLSDLEYREGKGLFGKIRWTDIGRRLVENRVFRWLSPSWIIDKLTREPVAMTSCALTNRPSQMAQGLDPIINSVKTVRGVSDERQCAVCKAWDGKEVTYGGKRVKGLPSYVHAKGQGLHHPGCRCTLNEDAKKEFSELTKEYTDMEIEELKNLIKEEIKAELIAEAAQEAGVVENEAKADETKAELEAKAVSEETAKPEETAEAVVEDEAKPEEAKVELEPKAEEAEVEKKEKEEPEVIDVQTLNSLPKPTWGEIEKWRTLRGKDFINWVEGGMR